MTLATALLQAILLGLIRAYQLFLAPVLPASCRFDPGCSAYAIEAIRRFGPLAGGWLGLKRIARCHPWGGAGLGPVPERLHPCCPPAKEHHP